MADIDGEHGNRTVTVTSEATERPQDYHYLTSTEIIVALVFIYALDMVIIIGNGLVVMAFLRDTQLQVTRNYYIFNLAISDLVIGFFVVPFYSSTVITGMWPLGWPFCVLWNIVHNTTLLTSHVTIVFITFDRYLLVKDALEYHATEIPKRAIYRISITWVLVAVVKTALIIWGEWYFSQEGSEPSCSPRSRVEVPYIIGLHLYDVIFTTVCVICEVLVPLVLIAVFNIKVYRMIRRRHLRQSAIRDLVQRSLPSFQVMTQVTVLPERRANKRWAWASPSACPALCSCICHNEWHKRMQVLPRDSWTDTRKDLKPTVGVVKHESGAPEKMTTTDHEGEAGQEQENATAVAKSDIKIMQSLQASKSALQESGVLSRVLISDRGPKDGSHTAAGCIPAEAATGSTSLQSAARPNVPTALAKVPAAKSTTPAVNSPAPTAKSPAPTTRSSARTGRPNSQWRRCSISVVPGILDNVADNESISSISSVINLENVPEAHSPPPQQDTASQSGSKDPPPVLESKKEGTAFIFPSGAISEPAEAGGAATIVEAKQVQFRDEGTVRICSSHNSVAIMSKVKKKQDSKARLTVTLYILFFICFKLPFGLILWVYAICRSDCIDDNLYEAFTWLYYAKSLVDPFLYAFICKRFRNYCMQIMRKIPGLKQCFEVKQSNNG